MGFGPVSIVGVGTQDVDAPGAPGLSAVQLNNSTGRYTLTPPVSDAGGGPLSGLTFAEAVVLEMSAFDAEQYRNDFDAAKVANGAQNFTHDVNSGDPVEQEWNIANPGREYSILARVADHARE